jgi:hypothetical protein
MYVTEIVVVGGEIEPLGVRMLVIRMSKYLALHEY